MDVREKISTGIVAGPDDTETKYDWFICKSMTADEELEIWRAEFHLFHDKELAFLLSPKRYSRSVEFPMAGMPTKDEAWAHVLTLQDVLCTNGETIDLSNSAVVVPE